MSHRLSRIIPGILLALSAACQDQVTDPTLPLSAAKGGGKPPSTCPGLPVGTSGLVVTPGASSLAPGETVDLEVTNQSGAPVPDCAVKWSSANTAVATVNNIGLVLAVAGGGPVTIKAQTSGRKPLVGTAFVTVTAAPPPPPPPPPPLTGLSAGDRHACSLRSDGAAFCWGRNDYGQLGAGSIGGNSATPLPVAGGVTFTQLTSSAFDPYGFNAAGGHTCGLTPGGTAYCWGPNADGALGDGTTSASGVPLAVSAPVSFVQVVAGGNHTCGLSSSGAAWCWGRNSSGQLGDGTTTDAFAPVAVTGNLSFASLAAGLYHTCGLTSAGAAYCWGYNYSGQLGDGTLYNPQNPTPKQVLGGLTFKSLTAGFGHTCGVTTDDIGYCWGRNDFGELGDGTQGWKTQPEPVAGGLQFSQIATRVMRACGLTPAGKAYCWGGFFSAITTPEEVQTSLAFTRIAAGDAFFCALTATRETYCWGANDQGQLGDGSYSSSTTPVKVLDFLP